MKFNRSLHQLILRNRLQILLINFHLGVKDIFIEANYGSLSADSM